MEKKILRTFRFLNSLFSGFGEARFIYDEPPKDAELPKPEAERRPPEVEEKAEAEEAVKRTSGNEQEKFKTGVEAGRKLAELRRAEKLPDPNEAGKGAPANAGQTKRRPEEAEAGRPKLGLEKKAVAPLPVKPAIPIEEFLKRDLVKQHSELDRWSINIKRDQTKYNADTWDHSTIDGLKRIYQECNDLGIFDENQGGEYYETVFAVLRSAAHDDNPYRSDNDGAYVPMFANPVEGTPRQTISGLQPKGVPGEDGYFPGGEAFIRAYDSLVFLKAKVLIRQDKAQLSTADALRKMDEDPIGTTVVDFGKRNIAVIQQAMKERDYATLAVYGVGAYALWQTLGKKLWGDDAGHGDAGHVHKGFDFKKWVMIGAAVYGADKMLKNAGYDVMKMAGFKDMNAEVKGTPLESMQNILNQHNYEEYKDFDYGIALRMNGRSLVSLQELLLNANKSGIHIIQPNLFPNEFPDLRGFTANNDEKGINENKHSAGQRECNRVGKQLYLLAKAMGIVYDNTLHTHHKRFKSMSYDEALKNSVLQNSNILYMLEAAGQFAPPRAPGGLFSVRKLQEEEDKLREGTGKVLGNNGFDLVEELHPGSGHFSGFLKGFPVVVIVANDGYQVFLRNRYGKNYNAVPGDADATIPLEGPAMERGAQDAVKKVDERMKELVKKLQDGNKSIKDAKYENGKWVAITEFKGAADLGVAASDVPTLINIAEYGERLTLSDGETSSEKYLERDVLGRLLWQADFHALRLFGAANRLSIEKNASSGAGVFTLLIGKNKQIAVDIEYTKGVGFKFKNSTDEEKMLKKGSGFSEELKEALGEDQRLEEVTENWKRAISDAPSSYLINFITHVPDIFTKATLANPFRGMKLDMVDGSVARNYALSLIEAQKGLILAKVANGINGTKTLAEVSNNVINKIYNPAVQDLDSLSGRFVELTTQHERDGKDFSEEEFNETILYKIAEIGIQSNDYKAWYGEFTNELFLRYGMNNLRTGNAKKARDVVKVFAFYTAVLDDPGMDGANLSLSITKETEDYIQRINTSKRGLVAAGTAAPTDAEIAVEVNSGLAVADSNPLKLPNLTAADVVSMRDTEIELEKTKKYKNNAKYAKYVAHQIYAKISQVDDKTIVPSPEDGNFWKIDDYDHWSGNNPLSQTLHEFIDSNERLKMNRDYVTLDKYFEMSAADRKKFKDENIILPREDKDIMMPLDANGNPIYPHDLELIQKLCSVSKISPDGSEFLLANFAYTDVEKKFSEKTLKFLNKIEDDYKKDGILTGRFFELKDQFVLSGRLAAQIDPVDHTPTNSEVVTVGTNKFRKFDYKFDKFELQDPNDPTKTLKEDKQLVGAMNRLEQRFPKNNALTITHSQQIGYINSEVQAFVEQQVLSDEGKAVYFQEKDGLLKRSWNAIKQTAKDIKEWF